jgi:hypothetical protein
MTRPSAAGRFNILQNSLTLEHVPFLRNRVML